MVSWWHDSVSGVDTSLSRIFKLQDALWCRSSSLYFRGWERCWDEVERHDMGKSRDRVRSFSHHQSPSPSSLYLLSWFLQHHHLREGFTRVFQRMSQTARLSLKESRRWTLFSRSQKSQRWPEGGDKMILLRNRICVFKEIYWCTKFIHLCEQSQEISIFDFALVERNPARTCVLHCNRVSKITTVSVSCSDFHCAFRVQSVMEVELVFSGSYNVWFKWEYLD